MSIISTLAAADERLAGQIDKVSDAVQGIGAATQAARKRLALALDAARARLTGALADVEALAGELAADILRAAGEDLLAVPETVPEPAVPMSSGQQQKIIAMLDAEHPDFAPQTEVRCCESCDCGRDYCLVCNGSLSVSEPVAAVNRIASVPVSDGDAVEVNDRKDFTETLGKHRVAEANGRPKKRRR